MHCQSESSPYGWTSLKDTKQGVGDGPAVTVRLGGTGLRAGVGVAVSVASATSGGVTVGDGGVTQGSL